jgi:2-keto-4-pentenoate hydratase/2-oxohepta-3-ene-1,7-dioic acid hydratase in catechol pathway
VRLGTGVVDGRSTPVLEDGTDWTALSPRDTVTGLVADGPEAIERKRRGKAARAGISVPVLGPPLRPGKIVAIGLNYRDHVRETGMEAPDRPLVFAKFTSSVIASGESIEIDPSVTERVDWEGELAVVVGRQLRRASERDALAAVFGYTIANDVSARDVQFAESQWVRAKSMDTFCPIGPMIVTPDELSDPQDLLLQTRVNGEVVQSTSTAEMIFGIAELLSFCSRSFTLEPGDVLLTGTPWGCGDFMSPRRWLKDGDAVEVEIDGIGVLSNPVRDVGRGV